MQSKSQSIFLAAFAVVLGVTYSIASRPEAVSVPDDTDWLYVDHDLAGTRSSRLHQANTKNVSEIAKVCAYSFPDKDPSRTTAIREPRRESTETSSSIRLGEGWRFLLDGDLDFA